MVSVPWVMTTPSHSRMASSAAVARTDHSSGWMLLESMENTSRQTISAWLRGTLCSSSSAWRAGVRPSGVWRQAMVPPVASRAMRFMGIKASRV